MCISKRNGHSFVDLLLWNGHQEPHTNKGANRKDHTTAVIVPTSVRITPMTRTNQSTSRFDAGNAFSGFFRRCSPVVLRRR